MAEPHVATSAMHDVDNQMLGDKQLVYATCALKHAISPPKLHSSFAAANARLQKYGRQGHSKFQTKSS